MKRDTFVHRITADSLVIKDSQVLLMKRAIPPHKGSWILPGGSVEFGEAPERAALRELKEETNIKGKVKRLFNLYFVNDKKVEPRGPVFNLVYEITYLSGKIKGDWESSEIVWCPLDKLPADIGFYHRKVLREYLKQNKR